MQAATVTDFLKMLHPQQMKFTASVLLFVPVISLSIVISFQPNVKYIHVHLLSTSPPAGPNAGLIVHHGHVRTVLLTTVTSVFGPD